ncbi:hypothetical protein [Rhodovulum sp. 12E13]|uniref:hypothetical protein n=1 Tax=Rhodovulum sp. 12E13 TaxID=2203891 RepID=UPI00131440AB|nr:hypothetical protein [Rhodovulum sp. 12E13]
MPGGLNVDQTFEPAEVVPLPAAPPLPLLLAGSRRPARAGPAPTGDLSRPLTCCVSR